MRSRLPASCLPKWATGSDRTPPSILSLPSSLLSASTRRVLIAIWHPSSDHRSGRGAASLTQLQTTVARLGHVRPCPNPTFVLARKTCMDPVSPAHTRRTHLMMVEAQCKQLRLTFNGPRPLRAPGHLVETTRFWQLPLGLMSTPTRIWRCSVKSLWRSI